jgi:SAM-dependent methyltransferase
MPRSSPDFRRRAQLTELMDEPCSRDELRACLRDIARVNRWTMGYRPLLDWLDAMLPSRTGWNRTGAVRTGPVCMGPVRILDVGCGYGDGLRRVAQWAKTRRIAVELMGLDINPDAVAIAAEATPAATRIDWISSDVFAFAPRRPVHLVISSLFTHHLDEVQVVRFLKWMERNAMWGWFINDLSRGSVPYRLFSAFAKVVRLHPFVQHDGPVSIARSFLPEDWQRMSVAANFREDDVAIRSYRPARLCVARSKLP